VFHSRVNWALALRGNECSRLVPDSPLDRNAPRRLMVPDFTTGDAALAKTNDAAPAIVRRAEIDAAGAAASKAAGSWFAMAMSKVVPRVSFAAWALPTARFCSALR